MNTFIAVLPMPLIIHCKAIKLAQRVTIKLVLLRCSSHMGNMAVQIVKFSSGAYKIGKNFD